MQKLLLKDWSLTFDNKTIPALVPGDITIDLYNANLISNPYFGENYKDSTWIQRKDATYKASFISFCHSKLLLIGML